MSWVVWLALGWPVVAVALGLALGPLLRRATGPRAAAGPAPGAPGRLVRFSGNGADLGVLG